MTKAAARKPAKSGVRQSATVAAREPAGAGAEEPLALRSTVLFAGAREGEAPLVVPPPTEAERAAYDAEAAALPPSIAGLGLPFAVFVGEGFDVARFVWHRWPSTRDARTGAIAQPGLELALTRAEREGERTPRIRRSLAHEIVHLVVLAQQANNQAILAVSHGVDGSLDERALLLVSEIEAVLDWHFTSDGVADARDAQLAQVRGAHADDRESRDALAQRLQDYAALAQTCRAELDGLGGFESARIDEAFELVDALRARPARPAENGGRRSAIELRNRYVALALRRIALVRGAAQLVFRDHPRIVREVTSAYLRRRRAEARRARSSQRKAPPPPTP